MFPHSDLQKKRHNQKCEYMEISAEISHSRTLLAPNHSCVNNHPSIARYPYRSVCAAEYLVHPLEYMMDIKTYWTVIASLNHGYSATLPITDAVRSLTWD